MSRKLLRATSLVGGMTLLSRVLGLTRDVVFARVFGAGLVTDAFFVAFKIPNFMRRLFAEGAFSQAFVPVLSEAKATAPEEEVRELVGHVMGTLGTVLAGITVAGVLAAPLLIYLFAPGFSAEPDKFALSVAMLRLTFPYLMFISLTAMAGGVLNTYGRFAVPAFTPVLLNLALIGAAIWAAPHFARPGMALAWGVLIAGVAQLAFQLPFLARIGMLPRPRWGVAHAAVRRIVRLMLPALFGSSVSQLNLLIDTLIASFLVTGSVSWLYYSDRLMEFPLGVFAIALATVILPGLSSHHAKADREGFSIMLDWALRLVVLVVLPAAVGLFTLAGPMLTTIFRYGQFAANDVRMAEISLMAYAFGLLGFTFVKVLAPGYFARQDTRTPVRVGVIAVVANLVFNLGIVVPWNHAGLPAPHAGLALSTSLAAFINAGLLYRGLRRTGIFVPSRGWGVLLARAGFANLCMGLVLWHLSGPLADWLARSALARAEWLAALIGLGFAVYIVALAVAGLRPRHLKASYGRVGAGAL